jgi:hypothetical protein
LTIAPIRGKERSDTSRLDVVACRGCPVYLEIGFINSVSLCAVGEKDGYIVLATSSGTGHHLGIVFADIDSGYFGFHEILLQINLLDSAP